MSPFHPHHRPPWWPADEPWPPAAPPGMERWRKMRGRFFWRMAGLLALFFAFAFGGVTLTFWLMAAAMGFMHFPAGPFFLPRAASFIALLIGIAGIFFTARSLRRMTAPIGDLIGAASRLEAGDYATRVPERGPREVRALTRAFNEMAARLEKNEQQRRNLLADVTHELRTPLTVIQGSLEGLLDGLYPRDDAHLEPILEETQVMSRLIEDLRTLSLAESGALKLHREPTDLSVLANDAAASYRARAKAEGIELRVAVDPELPLLDVDPARIREVLVNLITNSLRHTPRGGQIEISADSNSANGAIAVAVTDNGSGISAETLPYVFDRFYKSQNSRGTGLGLAIAKNLVAAHGGEIFAFSDGVPGKGTTIRFTLPR